MTKEIEIQLQTWRGYSAYEMAVRNGFEGTEQEWLNSLHGRDGGVATVNGVAHDAAGNVELVSENIPVSSGDQRTMKQIADETDKLARAISVTDDAVDLNGRYLDNARFR